MLQKTNYFIRLGGACGESGDCQSIPLFGEYAAIAEGIHTLLSRCFGSCEQQHADVNYKRR